MRRQVTRSHRAPCSRLTGSTLAFVAVEEGAGRPQLWVRALDAPEPRVLPKTDSAYRPFWSADSRALGFFADGKLKVIGLADAMPRTVTTVGYRPTGGSWSPSGVIVFADRQSPLYAVPAGGGQPTPLTTLDAVRGDISHQSPDFLPDGRHLLYHVTSPYPDRAGTWVGTIDAPERTKLMDDVSSAVI